MTFPLCRPRRLRAGGGGGGGDRDKLQASQGRLPKQSMQQFTPPVAVVRNLHPKLRIAPTIVVPPDIHLQQPNMPDLGDPLSHLPPCLRMERAMAAALAPVTAAALVRAKVRDSALAMAAAPAAVRSGLAVVFPLRR